MRIAIFSDTYEPDVNGVAKTLKRYTNYLEQQGIEYRLFVPNASNVKTTFNHIQRFTSFPFIFYPECRVAVPNLMIISSILEDFKPTLIHLVTPFNLGLCGLHYGKKYNIPMIASYHTHFDEYLNYYHLSFAKKWIVKYMTWFHRDVAKIYVPSESTRKKILDQKVHYDIDIWGRGVNHSMYTPEKKTSEIRGKYNIREKHIILYVGRIAPEKDVDIAIDTFLSLPQHLRNESHLLIVGDGPLQRSLSSKKEKQITWTGFVEGENLAKIYASSDLFLFPSPTETFGNVVLEALSSGLPVIAANAGGVKHLVEHNQSGYLCEPKNITQFVTYTSMLLEKKEVRKAFSIYARKTALSQSWDHIFEKLITSFYEVLEKQKTNKTA